METRYITIHGEDYEVFYHEKYTGGHGGGSNFPDGEPDPQYEIVLDELIDAEGNKVEITEDLETLIFQQI